ncbi:MAG: hypothetical protein H6744_13010, partial [Deltaproteobacteria bacterium]|nr:hypothetical protein [Deltaproteobacteria bacterium]
MAIYPEVPSLPASICDPRRAAGVRPGAALVWAVFVALACAAFGAGCAGTAGGDAPDSAADILEDADSGDTAAVDTAPGEGLSCQRRDWRAATQRVVLRDARPLLRCANQRTLLVPRVLGDLPAGQARLWRYDVASGASG